MTEQSSPNRTTLRLRLAEDLERKGYASRTIGIKLRYSDFQAVTRDLTLPNGIKAGADIRKAAGECLKRVPLEQKIRLLGVRASGLLSIEEIHTDTAGVQSVLPF